MATLTSMDTVWIALIGLGAGTLGGMLGVGGSVLMIPALTMLFGYNQHLYQASAMLANVAVSIAATLHHYRAGWIVPTALKRMLPIALIAVLAGVALSNTSIFSGQAGGLCLGRFLAVFAVYVIYLNVRCIVKRVDEEPQRPPKLAPARCALVGGAMGGVAGLLGVGGGVIAVPMQHLVLGMKLRSAIATSSALICLTATAGAIYKIGTLSGHDQSWLNGVQMGLALAPTAWIGGRVGAGLTHRLPLRQVRTVFILLMLVAMVEMAAVPWGQCWDWLTATVQR
jgi:uncharacterized membrane protein YfcA